MFNIFRYEGVPMTVSTQVHKLFSRFQHPQLQDTVKALEVRADLDGITYSEADFHLTAAVSKIPDYQLPQNVSGIQASGGNSGGGGPCKGCSNRISINNS